MIRRAVLFILLLDTSQSNRRGCFWFQIGLNRRPCSVERQRLEDRVTMSTLSSVLWAYPGSTLNLTRFELLLEVNLVLSYSLGGAVTRLPRFTVGFRCRRKEMTLISPADYDSSILRRYKVPSSRHMILPREELRC